MTVSDRGPADAHPYRVMGAEQQRTLVALVLKRSAGDGAVELAAESPGVAGPQITPS